MATLFNTTISQTYEGLIKTIDNSAISTSLKELTDGSGNQLGLFVDNQGNFKATNIVEFGGLQLSGVVINKIVTSADGIENFNNDTSLPTSAAVKTYVDNIVTVQDLDFGGNSGGGSVDLDSEVFMLIGTNGIVTSASGSNALSISGLALETSIDINTSNIVVNAQNIATNTSNIALNVSDIATNVANISTNATNISTNAQSIASTQSSLEIEILTRQNDVVNLQANIDTETASRIAADNILTTNLANEVSDRQSADTILQGNIDAEETARISADNTLQANINAEATTRANEDTTLQANINTETGLRSSADTLLQSNIDAEALTRQGADTTLQNNIDTEESARISADTTLQTNITSEQNSRIAADTTLQNQITLNDTDITNLQNDKQNISEKGQASGYVPLDANAKIQETYLPASVLGGLSYQGLWNASTNTPTLPNPTTVKGHYYVVDVAGTYQGQVYNVKDWVISDGVQWGHVDNTESVSSVFGRLGNVVANQSDYSSFYPLISDLSNEITNRTNADTTLQNNINTEASTRATNDTTLQTNIDNEETARINADTNLQTNISNEASTRAVADTNLQLNIDAEELARINADVNLQNNINAITLSSLGFTGDTNANYITNNNQLINGAGYLTTTSASTTYLPLSAGSGKPLSGDLYITKADTPLIQLLDTTNNKTLLIGVDDNNAFIRSGSGQKLLFQVNGSTPTAALTLLNNGDVGIGTDSPSARLMVETGADEGIRIYRASTNANFGAIEFRNSDDTATNSRLGFGANYMRIEGTNNLRFITNSAEAMRINSDGNVGIGTTNIGTQSNLYLGSMNSTEGGQITFQKATNGTLAAHIDAYTTGGKDFMRILSGGDTSTTAAPFVFDLTNVRVGIGTQNPSVDLEVDGVVKYKTQRSTGSDQGEKAFIGIASGQGAQKYLIYKNTSVADGYANFKIHRAYDYGNNDQMVQDAIYQRRGVSKNFVFKYEGDISTSDDVYLEVYKLSNDQVEIWLCVDDYAAPVVEIVSNPGTSEIFTSPSAGTPTGTLISSSNPDTETPNWNSYQGDGKFSGDVEVAGDLTVTGDINGAVAVDSLMHTFPIKSGSTMAAKDVAMLDNNGDIFPITFTGSVSYNLPITSGNQFWTNKGFQSYSSWGSKKLQYIDNNGNFIQFGMSNMDQSTYVVGGSVNNSGAFTFNSQPTVVVLNNGNYPLFTIDPATFGTGTIEGIFTWQNANQQTVVKPFSYNVSSQTFNLTYSEVNYPMYDYSPNDSAVNIGSGKYLVGAFETYKVVVITVSNGVQSAGTITTIGTSSMRSVSMTRISNSAVAIHYYDGNNWPPQDYARVITISGTTPTLASTTLNTLFARANYRGSRSTKVVNNKYYIEIANGQTDIKYVAEMTFNPSNNTLSYPTTASPIPEDEWEIQDIYRDTITGKIFLSGTFGNNGNFGTVFIDYNNPSAAILYDSGFDTQRTAMSSINNGKVIFGINDVSIGQGVATMGYGVLGDIVSTLKNDLVIGVNENTSGRVKLPNSVVTDTSLSLTPNSPVYVSDQNVISATSGVTSFEIGYAISANSYILKIR